MRVIDPKRRLKQQKKPKAFKRPVILLALVIFIVCGSFILFTKKSKAPTAPTNNSAVNQNIPTPSKKGTLKIFTGQEFRDLYNTFAYPNTQKINEDTPITDDSAADARIRKIAAERGYQLRSAPVTNTFMDAGDGFKLQQRAAQPWIEMKTAAKKENINLGLTAGYRSAEEQKILFLERLSNTGIPVSLIYTGAYDQQLSQVLRTTAIPGYSRHHTGYTIDISCADQPYMTFENSVCFKWLNADNYKNAKTYGWIPSYPEGTELQGPDPESWEYVWVGKDALTE